MKTMLLPLAAFCLAATAPALGFELKSADISEGGTVQAAQLSNMLGCTGGNQSPSLAWSNAPAGTRSFVVTLYDPDAPTGSGWWHWTVFDIPATASSLPRGAGAPDGRGIPAGALQGANDAGASAFMGPCPPPGPAHHYVVTITALKVDKLGLDGRASGAMIGYLTHANALASASITATYGR